MTKSRTLRKAGAVALSLAMALSIAGTIPASAAAKKVKLSSSKGTITVGKTKKVTIKNTTKANIKKVTFKFSNTKKRVSATRSGLTLKFKGKKAGTVTITSKITLKKAVAKKKTYSLKYKATVKKAASTALTGVSLSSVAPVVGETLTANTTPAKASDVAGYAWFTGDTAEAVNTAIEGETTASLAITDALLNKFIKVVVTNNAGKTFEAVTTTAVGKATDGDLLDLKATGAKVLTATMSKALSIEAKDIVVKKGTVVLTPAEVKVDGTSLIITLGSKIVKDTYSVEYNNKTVSCETEDEKLVELKTVGTALAQAPNGEITPNGTTALDIDGTTLNAIIDYKALNQYGEAMNAEILSITSTFGGATNFTEPTTKKDGRIFIYNIPAAIAIPGNKGNIIIVAKNGVSTTNEVVMSEEAKVAKITLAGIYNKASGAYVDAIPAGKDASNFALVIDAVDQYDRPIGGEKLEQTVSVAQVLTNINLVGVANNKLVAADSFETVEVAGVEKTALKLQGANAKAGTLQIIIVGDRFGSVFNETVKVEQMDLIKSFSFQAKDTIYNKYGNELEFTATSVAGKDVKDYATLSKLVKFSTTALKWEKQTDGTAKLKYTPNEVETPGAALETGNDNLKQNTVLSVTAIANADISAADQIVVPKTFTVYEKKVPFSVVKYTGDVVATTSPLDIKRGKLVIEDQYGNTMSSADSTLATASIDYRYGDSGVAATDNANDDISGAGFAITTTAKKLYLAISPYARATANDISTFSNDKAQLTLALQKVDDKKATDLKAEWSLKANAEDTNGQYPTYESTNNASGYLSGTTYALPVSTWYVSPNQATSEINKGCFTIKGKVNGKTITINPANYSIKRDTYVPITNAEAETAIKEATVTFTVTLTDDENNEYTQEVDATYKYSAAPSKVAGFADYKTLVGAAPAAIALNATDEVNADDLGLYFAAYDQYGQLWTDGTTPTLEISTGDGTDAWKVVNNNKETAKITNIVSNGSATVIATLKNGMTATQSLTIEADADFVEQGLNTAAAQEIKSALQSIAASGATFTIPAAYRAGYTASNSVAVSAPVTNTDASWSYNSGVFTVDNTGDGSKAATAAWTCGSGNGNDVTVTLTLTGDNGAATYTVTSINIA